MLLRGDINRIYDDEYRAEQNAKKEKLFIRRPRQRKMKNAKWFDAGMGIDLPFCVIIFVLLTVGTIMMFSASYAFAYYTQDDSYYYLIRQLIFIGLGVAAMAVMSLFNYNKLHQVAPVVLIIAYAALLLVLLLPSGDGGVKRWIPLGMFNIQPSEIAKFAVILFFAHWCSKYYNKMQLPKFSVLPGRRRFRQHRAASVFGAALLGHRYYRNAHRPHAVYRRYENKIPRCGRYPADWFGACAGCNGRLDLRYEPYGRLGSVAGIHDRGNVADHMADQKLAVRHRKRRLMGAGPRSVTSKIPLFARTSE